MPLSGEMIAGELGISRAAVWKAIKALRADGYEIGAATRVGYQLAARLDVFSAYEIARHLADPRAAGLIRFYESLPSTSRLAKELAIEGAPHGTAVVAAEQSAGGGHGATAFSSPRGGIYLSMIIRPGETVANAGRIRHGVPTASVGEDCASSEPENSGGTRLDDQLATIGGNREAAHPVDRLPGRVAEAVREVLEQVFQEKLAIREHSAIFCGEKKICGIMTEAARDMESGEVLWIVTGVGIPRLPEGAGRSRIAAELIGRILSVCGG